MNQRIVRPKEILQFRKTLTYTFFGFFPIFFFPFSETFSRSFSCTYIFSTFAFRHSRPPYCCRHRSSSSLVTTAATAVKTRTTKTTATTKVRCNIYTFTSAWEHSFSFTRLSKFPQMKFRKNEPAESWAANHSCQHTSMIVSIPLNIVPTPLDVVRELSVLYTQTFSVSRGLGLSLSGQTSPC